MKKRLNAVGVFLLSLAVVLLGLTIWLLHHVDVSGRLALTALLLAFVGWIITMAALDA